MYKIALSWILLISSVSSAAELRCPNPWICIPFEYRYDGNTVKLRAGYIESKTGIEFRGNILYLQGLADSMLNHLPFFSRLSEEGYRVIAFDYMGQGGSEGSMNDTRIAQIGRIGNAIWNSGDYTRDLETYPIKTIIGWSTGGLAAYYQAHLGNADRVVMIAPGIAPKVVGRIRLSTLTTARYKSGDYNPHIDPIFPIATWKVPDFVASLMAYAIGSPFWKISKEVQGLVLLSGREDKYVYPGLTRNVVEKQGFQVEQYEGALHEIDNEVPEIQSKFFNDIVKFLKN